METETEKVVTGTSRVFSDGEVRIPGPTLPTKAEATPPSKPKVKEEKPAPFVVVSTKHIIETLSKSSAQNRLSRLKTLSRVNRDVAWLLDEYEKLSNATPEDSEKKPDVKSKSKKK